MGQVDGAHQGGGVLVELAPGRGQGGSRLVAHEKPGAELLLQGPDAGADRGLGYVEALSGAYEAAGGYHGQKGSGPFRVHFGS